jgi:hypothetical protein
VSWDLRWYAPTGHGSTVDPAVGFRLDFMNTNAHRDWSMSSGDRSFHTNAAGQTAVVAFVGRERNGVFFNARGDDGDLEEE